MPDELGGFLEDLREYYPSAVTCRDVLLCVEQTERELAEIKSAVRNLAAQKGGHNTEIAYKRLIKICK